MYLDRKKVREFEEKIGFETIINNNIEIGKSLNFEPKIEYAVCANGSCCYSPSNIGYNDWRSQKSECDRWLAENKLKFPDGRIAQEGYTTTKLEHYPNFHSDWNHLIEAIRRLNQKEDTNVLVDPDDIFNTWVLVHQLATLKK